MTNPNEMNAHLANDIVAFYDFIDSARKVMATKLEKSSLCSAVDARVEVPNQDSSTAPADTKFESAIHADIHNIEKLLPYLAGFTSAELQKFKSIIDVEVSGLEGDMSIREKLIGTIPGAIFTGISVSLVWFGFWSSIYYIEVIGDLGLMLKDEIISFSAVEAILIIVIMLGGTFGVFSYVYQAWRGRKQASYLRAIKRALSLYLLDSADV